MTNKTQALGRRIIGALRNENILVIVSTTLEDVSVLNLVTDKQFYYVHTGDVDNFNELISDIKADPGYPAPKQRKVYAQPKIRHTSTTAVNMGRFIPGNLSAISEGM